MMSQVCLRLHTRRSELQPVRSPAASILWALVLLISHWASTVEKAPHE
jgi:hypothetical protein